MAKEENTQEQKFDIDHQWSLYLERIGLKEEQLPENQKTMMKRTFYGAWGQLLVLMRDEVTQYSDEKGANILADMMKQVMEYYYEESE